MSATALQSFVTDFERTEGDPAANGKGKSWVAELRKQAMARFSELGFPTTKLEDWKFTDTSAIARTPFRPAAPASPDAIAEEVVRRLTFGLEDDCYRLVFLDGRFSAEWTERVGGAVLPAGLFAGSLAASLTSLSPDVEPHLGKIAPWKDHAFVALNTAFLGDGAYISVPRGLAVDRPLHLLFLASGAAGEPTVTHPRNLIVVGAGSQVAVVETYASAGEGVYLTNSVTEVALEDDARLDHSRLQLESEKAYHVGKVAVRQARSSSWTSRSISLGAALARIELDSELGAEGAECSMDGLYLVGGRQFVDHHTSIDHAMPHCTSREFYKGVLDGRAKAVFNGKIVVRPDAQKTDARQTNRNLVLSDETSINSKPELQIFANDVKCAHGATVGQIDHEATFYLRSRGIEANAARAVLTYAFAREIVDTVAHNELRDHIVALVGERLPAGAPELP